MPTGSTTGEKYGASSHRVRRGRDAAARGAPTDVSCFAAREERCDEARRPVISALLVGEGF